MDAGTWAMRPRGTPLAPRLAPVVSNVRLAMVVVLAGESMLFAGLIGAYLVFRLAAPEWPPAGLPRLPLAVTAANTCLLLASLAPLRAAVRALGRTDGRSLQRGLQGAALLGAAFVTVQGVEWLQLVRHGLTLGSGMYGATFYVLIGCHGLHVLIAVGWLAAVALASNRGWLTAARHGPVEACAIYWCFVCALWMILFPLVYLY
jgi:cytochrome c oxidase subunit 3